MSTLRRYLPLATVLVAIAALYLYKLDGVGFLGPDEPRYAAIGRWMGQSGQLVTPRLWGTPWFEKPPLLYWMTALGTAAGLNAELSARVPVAVLSLAFLMAMFLLVRADFGFEAAAGAVIMLGTSAGWMVFSDFGLTDLPLAVCFSLAVLVAVRIRNRAEQSRFGFVIIGALLGLGTLAKGLVPIALAVPFLWFLRHQWRSWWLAAVAFALVALPWYIAVYQQNGWPFVEEFFVRHHLRRLYSPTLQHPQPPWYYLPVLLAGILPWTPLLGLLFIRSTRWDETQKFLAAIVLFGLLVFSLSLNKLPGYLLPLLPSLLLLIAIQLKARVAPLSRAWLVGCAILVAVIPLCAPILPPSLSAGRLTLAPVRHLTRTDLFYILLPVVIVFVARRAWVGALLALCVVSGSIYLKSRVYPVLDRDVSARQMAAELRNVPGQICEDWANRDWVYGLSFYRGALYPPCSSGHFDYALRSHGHGRPALEPLK